MKLFRSENDATEGPGLLNCHRAVNASIGKAVVLYHVSCPVAGSRGDSLLVQHGETNNRLQYIHIGKAVLHPESLVLIAWSVRAGSALIHKDTMQQKFKRL